MDKYIGISDDRLHHILGVARKAYKIALERGHDEKFARKMFVLGFNHDIGYEFSENKHEHPDVGVAMLKDTFGESDVSLEAIEKHGRYMLENATEEWTILNQADMQVDPKGNEVDAIDRLHEIRDRLGEWSNEYKTACDICYLVGLTGANFAQYLD